MAGISPLTRALAPALTVVVAPLLLLLVVQLARPALLSSVWPWLLAFGLSALGTFLFGRFLHRRAEQAGEQLLAVSRGDGGELDVLPFASKPLGSVQQALNTIIERHRHSESALRASEQRFQLALEASDAHLWEYCARSDKVRFDATTAYSFLGIDRTGRELSSGEYMAWLHPDDVELLRRGSEAFYRNGELNCEYRVRHAQRGYLWVRCRGRVVEYDDEGRPLRALGTICDITDLKQIEERLQSALIAAEDAGHARAQFLAGISHELRTPLNGVLGYTQLLLRDDTIGGEQRGHLETIERSGQHLLRLINDIIDLAQIDSGHFELCEVECDLYALLDNIAHVAREQAEAKRLQFALEIAPTLPPLVLLDALKLRQILSNLLNNAVKFTAAGTVTLRVRAAFDRREPALLFEVRDTGAGIDAAHLADLFDLRCRQAAGDDQGGGFGLAVSQRLCRLMGGEIEVNSAVGAGSCFRFSLPCHPIDEPAVGRSLSGVAGGELPSIGYDQLRRLPAAALAPLRSALALGDLEGLRTALSTLRLRVPAAQAVVDHCTVLLEGFELDRIRELLEDAPGASG